MKLRLSQSKIGLYYHCPYAFYLNAIEKRETVPTPPMILGSEIHKIFEDFYQQSDFLSKEKTIEIINSFKAKKPEHVIYIENFKAFNLKKLNAISCMEEFKPFLLEKKYFVNLNNKVDLSGVIDRVDIVNKKTMIIDYKTGNVNPFSRLKDQLSTYDFLYKKTTDRDVDFWAVYYPKADIFYSEESTNHFSNFVVPKIEVVVGACEENFFPKTGNCYYCLMRKDCQKGLK